MTKAERRVVPGFGLTMRYTLAYLGPIALIEILYDYNLAASFAVAWLLTTLALVTLVLKRVGGGKVEHTRGSSGEGRGREAA
jgi:ABC-type sulfate transport system permease subunit